MGKYVEVFKITTWNDQKLRELWNLHSHEKFAEQHREVLQELPEFIFGRYAWKFDENGKLVSALPYDEDEKFWNEDYKETNGNRVPVFEYDYVAAKTFFQNRGIGRYRLLDTKLWTYIHLEPPVVRTIDVEDARDFMFAFAEQNCSRFVNNQLLKGGSQYVGPFQMSRLAFIQPNFISPSRDEQYFYFRDRCWHITQHEVKEVGYESTHHRYGNEQRKNTDARYLGQPPHLCSGRRMAGMTTNSLRKAGNATISSSLSIPAISPGERGLKRLRRVKSLKTTFICFQRCAPSATC